MTRWVGERWAGLVALGMWVAAGCTPNPAPPPTTPPPPIAKPAPASATHGSAHGTVRTILASAAPAPAPAPAAAPAPSDSQVVARVGTKAITKDDLLAPMLEAYGLNFLLHVTQLELAKQAAAQQKVTVTPDDFKKEHELTFQRMFKESEEQIRQRLKEAKEKGDQAAVEKLNAELNVDRESLLDQYLAQSRPPISRQEFELAMQTGTYLRRIAESSSQLKGAITDEILRKSFGAKYGEKAVVRHIQAANAADLQAIKARLDAGENFAQVAEKMSTNKDTAPVGGAIPPFTVNTPNVPQAFRDIGFALKPGEVSDPVNVNGAYHLLKVESRIPPKVVKFEDVKESLRAELQDQILQAATQQLRSKLMAQTRANLKIENPVLKAQYDKKVEESTKVRQAELDDAMKRDRAVPAAAGAPAPPAGPAQPDLVAPPAQN